MKKDIKKALEKKYKYENSDPEVSRLVSGMIESKQEARIKKAMRKKSL